MTEKQTPLWLIKAGLVFWFSISAIISLPFYLWKKIFQKKKEFTEYHQM